MMKQSSKDLIGQLARAVGPSGFEKPVGDIIRKHLDGIGTLETDRIGNIVCEIAGIDPKGQRVLFAAHQDEIGFMVSEILDNGFIKFVAIGGWNTVTLPASPVEILNADGDMIPGIIGQLSPHFLKKGAAPQIPELDDLFIDIGASTAQEVQQSFGIRLGAIIVPVTRFHFCEKSGCIMSKAFDDRIGVAALIELGTLLAKDPISNTVVLAFTVQEEVGTRGAKVLANRIEADVALVVEGAPADDVPGGPAHPQTCVGNGAHVRIFDPTHIGHPDLLRFVRSTAASRGIRIQEAVRKGGGTDAMVLALADRGIPSVVTGVPVRYAHSHNCLVSFFDYRELVLLLHAVCQDMPAL